MEKKKKAHYLGGRGIGWTRWVQNDPQGIVGVHVQVKTPHPQHHMGERVGVLLIISPHTLFGFGPSDARERQIYERAERERKKKERKKSMVWP